MSFQNLLQINIMGIFSFPIYTTKINFIIDGMTYGLHGLEPIIHIRMDKVFANVECGEVVSRSLTGKKPDDIRAILSSTGQILVTSEVNGVEYEYQCTSIEIDEIFIEVPTQYSKTISFKNLQCLNGENKDTLKWEEIKSIEPMRIAGLTIPEIKYTNLYFKGKEYFSRYNIPHSIKISIDWENRSISFSSIGGCTSRPQSDRDGGWEHIVNEYSAFIKVLFNSNTSMIQYLQHHDIIKESLFDREKVHFNIKGKISEVESLFGIRFNYSFRNSIQSCSYDD